MAHVDWYIEGKAFGNCNCVYGCPCQFEDLPTDGHCQGFEVLHIDKGHFGDVDLTGLRTAMVYAWPGPVFEGNGEMHAIIDDNANRTSYGYDELNRQVLQRNADGKEYLYSYPWARARTSMGSSTARASTVSSHRAA